MDEMPPRSACPGSLSLAGYLFWTACGGATIGFVYSCFKSYDEREADATPLDIHRLGAAMVAGLGSAGRGAMMGPFVLPAIPFLLGVVFESNLPTKQCHE